jgi:hypothetical protein
MAVSMVDQIVKNHDDYTFFAVSVALSYFLLTLALVLIAH